MVKQITSEAQAAKEKANYNKRLLKVAANNKLKQILQILNYT